MINTLLLLLAACAVRSWASDPILRQVDIFTAGSTAPWGTEYACFRVPTAVRTADGSLVVLCESRIGSCNDQAPKDVTMRRSTDGGRTWSELSLVVGPREHRPSTATAPDFTARNPYASVLPNGSIVVDFVNSTDSHNCSNWQISSHDHGVTWGPATRKDFGRWEGVLMGPGAGIVLGRHAPHSRYAGRLVVCGATGYVGGMPMALPIYTSDDNGATYHEAGGSAPFPQLQECQLVELDDGRVMVNARTAHLNRSCNCRAYSISEDGGSSWRPYGFADDLVEPTCSAGLINWGGRLWFSNPAEAHERTHMTVKTSHDSGSSWQPFALVDPGPVGYSVMVPVDDRSVGVVYERGPYINITLAVLAPAPVPSRLRSSRTTARWYLAATRVAENVQFVREHSRAVTGVFGCCNLLQVAQNGSVSSKASNLSALVQPVVAALAPSRRLSYLAVFSVDEGAVHSGRAASAVPELVRLAAEAGLDGLVCDYEPADNYTRGHAEAYATFLRALGVALRMSSMELGMDVAGWGILDDWDVYASLAEVDIFTSMSPTYNAKNLTTDREFTTSLARAVGPDRASIGCGSMPAKGFESSCSNMPDFGWTNATFSAFTSWLRDEGAVRSLDVWRCDIDHYGKPAEWYIDAVARFAQVDGAGELAV